MHRQLLIYVVSTALAGVMLVGCKPPPTYDMAKAEIANTENKIHLKEGEDIPAPAPVITMSGAYVDTERVSLTRPRSWLQQHLVIHGNQLPFVFYVSQILGDTGTHISYDKSIDRKKNISLDYSGTVRGALDELATASGYHYEVDNKNNAVSWTALVTKVFSIKFIPGESNYELGQTLDLSGSSSSSGSSSGSSNGISSIQDNQYSTLSGKISIWGDIESTIKQLLSVDGKLAVSESTTTITVTDHPENVSQIQKYINKINYELSKEVRIQVQILEVQLSDDFAYGINWELVKNYVSSTTSNALSIVSPNFTNVNPSTTLAASSFAFASTAGDFKDSNTIINALQQQGQVSIVTQPSVTTLNNQVAQISIQEMENYVSGSNVSQNDNGNTGGPETSTVTTGLNMYLLPKINEDKIYLQISTVLSTLVSLDSFNVFTGSSDSTADTSSGTNQTNSSTNSTGTTSGSGSSTSGSTTTLSPSDIAALATAFSGNSIPNFVQLPKVDARLINQRAVIKNGQTLILAGYKQFQNNTKNNKFFESDRLGGQSSQRNNLEVIFLITPIVIDEEDYFEEDA